MSARQPNLIRYAVGGAGTHLFNDMPLGTRAQSEALAPGEFRLTVQLPGGRSIEKNVLLVAGEVLKVSVDFGAE